VLLDLGGVVYVGDEPLPGALDAVERLRRAGIALRFITNTTRKSIPAILAKTARLGLALSREELLAPALAARRYLTEHDLKPFLLVHPDLEEDFSDLAAGTREAVVIGDAAERFTYEALNHAYRKLQEGAEFLALAVNRNFREPDGGLSLDAGPFVKALEYASGREAIVLGKPSAAFFQTGIDELGCGAGEVVMIGDDAEADVLGALDAGLKGVLVRTGKYHSGQETALRIPPTHVARDLSGAVDWILGR